MKSNESRSVVEMFTERGEVKEWRRLTARIPGFLEKYPLTEAWRCERCVQEAAAALAPQLSAMHLAAISAGKVPADLGLPPLPTGYVFTCTLIHPNGLPAASGSAYFMSSRFSDFDGFKEYEKTETAAFQRLLASLGLGGEILDADEDRAVQEVAQASTQRHRQGRVDMPSGKAAVVDLFESASMSEDLPDLGSRKDCLAGVTGETVDGETPPDGQGNATQASEGATDETDGSAKPYGATLRPTATSVGPGRRPNDAAVLRAMQHQVTAMARQLHVDGPVVETLDQGRAALRAMERQLTKR